LTKGQYRKPYPARQTAISDYQPATQSSSPDSFTLDRVNVVIASVGSTRTRAKSEPAEALVANYITRASHYLPSSAKAFESEASLLEWVERAASRSPAYLILLDSRGTQHSSERFAELLGRLRDTATQTLILAIGPASGWSPDAITSSDLTLSFGPITLPHELARVVLAEQLYRALTILAGHPYHLGH
jgi:23S rRNA (pseudouridine1915-N3)-methyltransferase